MSLATRETWMHAALALVVVVVVPSLRGADGKRLFAWSMFSGSETYRVRVQGEGRDGAPHVYNPADLARLTSPRTAVYLAGADHFRNAPAGPALRASLGSLAHVACALGDLSSTTLVLEEREDLDAEVRATVATATCVP